MSSDIQAVAVEIAEKIVLEFRELRFRHTPELASIIASVLTASGAPLSDDTVAGVVQHDLESIDDERLYDTFTKLAIEARSESSSTSSSPTEEQNSETKHEG